MARSVTCYTIIQLELLVYSLTSYKIYGAMNEEAVHAGLRKTGMIILGGGLPKHHIYNANMIRNGADFAVIINTAQEFDGSDSGAHPDEAVSWGKIRGSAKSVKAQYQARIEELKSQGTVISYDVEEEIFDKLTGAIAKRKDRRPYYGNILGKYKDATYSINKGEAQTRAKLEEKVER